MAFSDSERAALDRIQGDHMPPPIDPRDFGAIEAKVQALSQDISYMAEKLDRLVAMSERGKGAIWMVTLLAGGMGAAVATAARKLFA